MKKNRENSTKSLLACAVMAGVLAGGVPSLAFADGVKDYIESPNNDSYSFTGDESMTEAATTGATGKTVSMCEYTLSGGTPTNDGITVADTHTITMENGTVSNFGTALNVVSGGTLTLDNVTFSGNTTDVANNGTMNIQGSVTMQTLTGAGTTEIQSGAELNLDGGDYTSQTFAGLGTLNLRGDSTLAVGKLGVAETNIAENNKVTLTSGDDTASKTLTKKITNGKVIVMNDVTSSSQNLNNTEVYLAGGTNLTLNDPGRVENIGINIKGYASGAGTLITACTGSAGTDYGYSATMDNIQVPLVNKGTLNLYNGTDVHNMTGKMESITNSGTLNIGADITLERTINNSGTLNINGSDLDGEMTNSGTVTFNHVSGDYTYVCDITGTINNSGTVQINANNNFAETAKIIGGKLILDGDYSFNNAKIQGLTELNVNGATYNFSANLTANPSVELIDADKVTGTTLKLGTVTATADGTLSQWELGTTKVVQYAKSTGNDVVVGNTAVVFSGDNHRFTFSQAKEDSGANKFGYLAIIKENGGELWQIVRNTSPDGTYQPGNVTVFSLTGDYTEQLKGAIDLPNGLGILTRTEVDTPRELTIEGNGHKFDGGDKSGIMVASTGDVLNFKNISEIKNWGGHIVNNNGGMVNFDNVTQIGSPVTNESGIVNFNNVAQISGDVTNNGGTVNFNNVTKLSSPLINTSGTVNFNGTTEVNSTLSGSGTFNNNGELTVAYIAYLDISELNNTGIVNIGNDTYQTLNTKINGGTLGILGIIIAVDSAKLAVNEIDIGEGKTLNVNGSTLGEVLVVNAGTLNLTVTTSNAFVAGGTVNINSDMTTTQTIMADELNLGTNTLTVTGSTDTTEFSFGKINVTDDNAKLNITKGKVTAYDEINSKIILGENVSLDIAAENIKKEVQIGNNAKLNLGDGTFASFKISSTNSGTVNFVGNVKVDGNLSLPKATFANGSTTTLTVTEGGDAPLQVTNTINVEPEAKLFLNGAEKGKTFKIVSGDAIADTFEGWALSNILGEDDKGRNVKAKSFVVAGNVYSIVFKSAIPENTDLGKLLENADGTPLMDWAEKVTDYFDTAYGDAGEAYTANAINSMASASVLAGAQKGAATMVNQVAGNISTNVGVGARGILGNRNQDAGLRGVSADVNDSVSMRAEVVETGLASEVMPTEYKDKVYDKQVWASYIHSKQKIDGLKAGSLTQNSTIQLNGVTVGADLWSGKKSFGGLAITYADGNANSSQISNSTKNEAKYYGISVYHRQDMGKYALTTDMGYTYNKNDITQHTTGITDEVTSKPKSNAYTVGMKLEREIYLSKACKIVPFAGARYTRLQNRDFSNSLGATTKVDNQNLVTVPVGLSFHSHLITTEGWKLGSILEGGYEWNFGNRHSTQEFGYGGAYNSIGFDVVDRGQYFVKAALTADYEKMFFELGYRYSKGKSVRDNKWNFNANFIF